MLSKNQPCKRELFPDQVEADEYLSFLLESYFDENNLKGTLMELISATIGPDPRSGKHGLSDISSTIMDVRNTTVLIRRFQEHIDQDPAQFGEFSKSLPYELGAVSDFDIDGIELLLYRALDCYIDQGDGFEDASLDYSKKVTSTFKEIYDWLRDCDSCRTLFLSQKGGTSC